MTRRVEAETARCANGNPYNPYIPVRTGVRSHVIVVQIIIKRNVIRTFPIPFSKLIKGTERETRKEETQKI